MINIFFRKLNTVIKEPKWLLIRLLVNISPLLSDELYLKLLFPLRTGYKLNLTNPITFNEKLQWLKINFRIPLMTIMVDKYEAKKYTSKILGDEYIVKTYGVWDDFDQIDIKNLPNKFVLKTTHDSGGVVICRDKNVLDITNARVKLNKHLSTKNYFITREWPYKNIKPKIMAEELLEDSIKGDLWDYKFYCFNGIPKVMYISMGRQGKHVPFYFYDMNFKLLNIERPNHEILPKVIDKPECWDEMIELAKKASEGFPHLRVDFYYVNGKILSGEYTFFQGGGMMPFLPSSWDEKLGSWINLNEIENDCF